MKHAAALRVSLLVALGIVPIACGTGDDHDSPGGSGGSAGEGEATAGTAGKSGSGGSAGKGEATAGTAGKSGGAGMTAFSLSCSNPVLDPVSGLVTCAEGYKHRPTAVACHPVRQSGDGDSGASSGGAAGAAAGADAGGTGEDLPAGGTAGATTKACPGFAVCSGKNSFCEFVSLLFVCATSCSTDADCGAGNICVCGSQGPTGGVCRPSDCTTDSDCSAGMLCASYQTVCNDQLQVPAGFACQTPNDQCSSRDDCSAPASFCAWNQDQGHHCGGGACGRPFLVRSEARLPAVISSAEWSSPLAPRVEHLDAAGRAALADHWARLGQMEHASIAAFARFGLQLLSLGAPPELVQACTQALADETAHTQLCFGIASAYAGRALGPGLLDVSNSLELASLLDIVDLVIAEGCVGETSAALEAREAADSAGDPVIRAAYLQIAEDEQRHAALAFRFVRWAMTRDATGVQSRIAAALAATPSIPGNARSVVIPCLQALLALPQAAAA